jgi:hypothetical protein
MSFAFWILRAKGGGGGTRYQIVNLARNGKERNLQISLEKAPRASQVRRDPLQRALENADRGPSLLNQGTSFQLADLKASLSSPAVPDRDEAWLGNNRFITAVTLLRHLRAISSGL